MTTKFSIATASLALVLAIGACSSQPPAIIKSEDAYCPNAGTGSDEGSSSGSGSKKKKGSGLALAGGGGYKGKLKGIIEDKCTSCHGKGGTSPELNSYDKVYEARKAVMSAISDETMPKGGTLEPAERDAFFAWKKNEYVEGSAASEGDDDSGSSGSSEDGSAKKNKKASSKDDDDDDGAKSGDAKGPC